MHRKASEEALKTTLIKGIRKEKEQQKNILQAAFSF